MAGEVLGACVLGVVLGPRSLVRKGTVILLRGICHRPEWVSGDRSLLRESMTTPYQKQSGHHWQGPGSLTDLPILPSLLAGKPSTVLKLKHPTCT